MNEPTPYPALLSPFTLAGKPLRIPFVIDSSLPRDEVVVLEMKSRQQQSY